MYKIIITEDGSHSVISEKFGVSYHSRHGAVTESIIVFLYAGYDFLRLEGYKTIDILEMGFGTGLNCFITAIRSEEFNQKTAYHAVEAYPLPKDIWSSLNYPEIISHENKGVFENLHLCPWNEWTSIHNNFTFVKYHTPIEDFQTAHQFDLIYHDGFAPSAQEHLWERSILQKFYQMLRPGGVLVTYCSKGSFKRNLMEIGFLVENLPGPPGKREITRARKV